MPETPVRFVVPPYQQTGKPAGRLTHTDIPFAPAICYNNGQSLTVPEERL